MERAGSGVALIVRRVAEIAGFLNPVVHLIAGRLTDRTAWLGALVTESRDFH